MMVATATSPVRATVSRFCDWRFRGRTQRRRHSMRARPAELDTIQTRSCEGRGDHLIVTAGKKSGVDGSVVATGVVVLCYHRRSQTNRFFSMA